VPLADGSAARIAAEIAQLETLANTAALLRP
jgi:hypothetical protein